MAYQPRNPNGSATSANSSPVVIASDQGAVPASQSGTWNIATLTDITNTIDVNIAQIGGATTPWSAASLEGDSGIIALAVRNDSATTTLTNANLDYAVCAVDLKGRQFITGDSGMTALKVDASGVAVPITDNSGSLTVDYATTGSGTATGALRVEIANNGTGVVGLNAGTNAIGKLTANSGVTIGAVEIAASQTLATVTNVATIGTSVTPGTGASNLGKAEDAAHASGDVGIMALAVRETTPTDLSGNTTNGDYEPLQVSRDGGLWSAALAAPQGGWSVATGSIGATKTDIGTANTAGCVGGWFIYNSNSSVVYVQFFNAQASAVTLGTTAPVYSLGIPATSGANVMSEAGIQHSTAICIAITTTRTGSTGPSSTVDYNIFYKQ